MSEKYYDEQGQVAVIHSVSYGSNWYRGYADQLFDPEIVRILLGKEGMTKKMDKIAKIAQEKWGIKDMPKWLAITWVEAGKQFRILEPSCDGWEQVDVYDPQEYFTA